MGLAELGYLVGQHELMPTIWHEAFRSTWLCLHCRSTVETPTRRPCTVLGGSSCLFAPGALLGDQAHLLPGDLAVRTRADGTISRAMIWVDDGTLLSEQWSRFATLLEAVDVGRVKVVVRAADNSIYQPSARTWHSTGPRLKTMLHLVHTAGHSPTAGGDFGHQHSA